MSRRRSRFLPALLAVGALAIAGCGSSSSSSTSSTSSSSATSSSGAAPTGFEGVALEQGPELAPAATTTPGTPVDGIQCLGAEQLAYHIHAHLAVYVNGASRTLPAAIGIPGAVIQNTPQGPVAGATGSCIYWLHTHTTDGVIHIESPTQRVYTLGNFFDEWGKVTALVNGKPWTQDPRQIPLNPHDVIQLDVGTATPPFQPISFDGTGL
jgi:hypothetical protein